MQHRRPQRQPGAEGLSGLARRGFFYAVARALLVSHWAVNSEATLALTTGDVTVTGAGDSWRSAPAYRQSRASRIR